MADDLCWICGQQGRVAGGGQYTCQACDVGWSAPGIYSPGHADYESHLRWRADEQQKLKARMNVEFIDHAAEYAPCP